MLDLDSLLLEKTPIIALVTETWLNDELTNNCVLHISHYSILRSDRTGRGGGVCILINNNYCRIVNTKSIENFDYNIIATKLIIFKLSINIICAYLPQGTNNTTIDGNRMQHFTADLLSCIKNNVPNILAGDFNLKNINWEDPHLPGLLCEQMFTEFCFTNGFSQLVSEPTRLRSRLDLLFCDHEYLISNVKCCDNFSTSDHSMVTFQLKIQLKYKQKAYKVFGFCKANWDLIRYIMAQVPWGNIISDNTDIASLWNIFYEIIYHAMYIGIPQKLVYQVSNNQHSCPKILKKLKAKKLRLWKKMKLNPEVDDYRCKFKQAARDVKLATYKLRCEYEESLLENRDTAAFYRYINSQLNTKMKLSSLLNAQGIEQNDPYDIAQELNNYFASIYTIENGIMPNFPKRINSDELNFIYFNAHNVDTILKQLKPSTSVGPDNIPNIMLKQLHLVLAGPLAKLFELSFIGNYIPECWKLACIIPIHKKGPTNMASNYRPISLTSNICKAMEKIISTQMWNYLSKHNLISERQFGFQKNSSTVLQLLQCHNRWTKYQNEGMSSDVIYLDYSKAFDSVVHSKLLYKLRMYGISHELYNWIENYLSNRSHYVLINNCTSDTHPVLSGVPQGTVLASLFFIIYVNDIVDICKPPVIMDLFADDGKVSSPVNSIRDCLLLQNTIIDISLWSDTWQLALNNIKTIVLHIGKSNPQFNYTLNNMILNASDEVVDLGVTMTSNLTFHRHIEKLLVTCHKKQFIMKKCFFTQSVKFRTRLFCSYIRPILEYGSAIWNPHSESEINQLEHIAETSLKLHSDSFRTIGFESLSKRRLIDDLVLYFKIISGLSKLHSNDFFTLNNRENRRSHGLSLLFPLIHTANYHKSFACRQINIWNSLPQDIITSPSPSAFKCKLYRYFEL